MDFKVHKRMRGLLKSLALDSISGILIGISVQVFAVNADFAPGGLNGAAVIVNHLTSLPIGILIVAFNIPIILLSCKLLGTGFLIKSVKSMLIGAFFMDHVAVYLPGYEGSPMLAVIFAGIFAGIGYALLYMDGSCTGGSDFLIMSIKKLNPHRSVGQLTQIIDGSVLLFAALVFQNIDAMLYGLIYTIICSTMIDRMMYKKGSGKMAMVITKKGQELCRAIDVKTGRGSTRFFASGGYQDEEKDVVICACSRKQIPLIRTVVNDLDPNAFMVVMEYDEVFGNGFCALNEEGNPII